MLMIDFFVAHICEYIITPDHDVDSRSAMPSMVNAMEGMENKLFISQGDCASV